MTKFKLAALRAATAVFNFVGRVLMRLLNPVGDWLSTHPWWRLDPEVVRLEAEYAELHRRLHEAVEELLVLRAGEAKDGELKN